MPARLVRRWASRDASGLLRVAYAEGAMSTQWGRDFAFLIANVIVRSKSHKEELVAHLFVKVAVASVAPVKCRTFIMTLANGGDGCLLFHLWCCCLVVVFKPQTIQLC